MTSIHATVPCSTCGEMNVPQRRICWMCRSALVSDASIDAERALRQRIRAIVPRTESVDSGSRRMLTLLLLTTAVVLILIGTWLVQPGTALGLAVLLIIPLIRTVLIVLRRSARGSDTDPVRTAKFFLLSAAVTTLMSWTLAIVCAVAVTLVAFIAFFQTCFGMMAGQSSMGEDEFLRNSFSIVAVCCMPLLILFGVWSRRRWNRDLEL